MGMADPTEMRAVSPWPGRSYIYRKETQTAVNTEPGIRGGEDEGLREIRRMRQEEYKYGVV